MKSFFQETRSLATGFVLGALVLGGGSVALAAWTAPTGAPPTSNIALPVNTSSTTQYKGGALGIGGLLKAYLGIDANSQRITAVATPTDGTDAVNKDYVDAFAQGGGGGSYAATGRVSFLLSKTEWSQQTPTEVLSVPAASAICASDYGSGWRVVFDQESFSSPFSIHGLGFQSASGNLEWSDSLGVSYFHSTWASNGGILMANSGYEPEMTVSPEPPPNETGGTANYRQTGIKRHEVKKCATTSGIAASPHVGVARLATNSPATDMGYFMSCSQEGSSATALVYCDANKNTYPSPGPTTYGNYTCRNMKILCTNNP